MIKNNKKLALYSSMAVAFFAGKSAVDAQIVYTDVDPDEVISDSGDDFEIDFDGDGTAEVTVLAYSTVIPSFFSTTGTAGYVFDAIIKYAEIYPGDNVSVAGYSYPLTPPYYIIFDNAIDEGDEIGEDLDFYDASIQQLTRYWGVKDFPSAGSTYDFFGNVFGVTYGSWVGEGEKFLGVKFEIDGNTHYGWVRMEVDDDYLTTTIMDFAYNGEADASLDAGVVSSIGDNTIDASKITSYSFGKTINIAVNNLNAESATVKVVNALGQVVYTDALNQNGMQISLDKAAQGIYTVHIEADGSVYNNKLMLN